MYLHRRRRHPAICVANVVKPVFRFSYYFFLVPFLHHDRRGRDKKKTFTWLWKRGKRSRDVDAKFQSGTRKRKWYAPYIPRTWNKEWNATKKNKKTKKTNKQTELNYLDAVRTPGNGRKWRRSRVCIHCRRSSRSLSFTTVAQSANDTLLTHFFNPYPAWTFLSR